MKRILLAVALVLGLAVLGGVVLADTTIADLSAADRMVYLNKLVAWTEAGEEIERVYQDALRAARLWGSNTAAAARRYAMSLDAHRLNEPTPIDVMVEQGSYEGEFVDTEQGCVFTLTGAKQLPPNSSTGVMLVTATIYENEVIDAVKMELEWVSNVPGPMYLTVNGENTSSLGTALYSIPNPGMSGSAVVPMDIVSEIYGGDHEGEEESSGISINLSTLSYPNGEVRASDEDCGGGG